MGMIIDRKSYEKLVKQDIEWLKDLMKKTGNENSLEGDHIIKILELNPELLYDYYYVKA